MILSRSHDIDIEGAASRKVHVPTLNAVKRAASGGVKLNTLPARQPYRRKSRRERGHCLRHSVAVSSRAQSFDGSFLPSLSRRPVQISLLYIRRSISTSTNAGFNRLRNVLFDFEALRSEEIRRLIRTSHDTVSLRCQWKIYSIVQRIAAKEQKESLPSRRRLKYYSLLAIGITLTILRRNFRVKVGGTLQVHVCSPCK